MSDPNPTPQAPAPAAPEQPKPQTPTATPAPEAGKRDAADAPLGEGGLKALQAERAERERLERELKPLQEQMRALSSAFGGKGAEQGEDLVKTLQQRMDLMERSSLVDRVARRHGITDDVDVDFLRGAPDETAMTRLAERLKVAATTAPTSPAHDPSQGSAPLSEKAAADAAYEAYYPTPSR